eukprot:CAMPEP_0118632218 /NCGR_PEP_ID=MMETSP0785-20121206/322_1 /TAXON_ID=91992 /ORGANISM="Bolidomonas pacifica, Strain CCMP 1866" /LENGTH=1155 /DNA_ID=CAMNT_0006522963 /DNA_START=122 /DNA_END=3585 /DNA_ORIENTATION=+
MVLFDLPLLTIHPSFKKASFRGDNDEMELGSGEKVDFGKDIENEGEDKSYTTGALLNRARSSIYTVSINPKSNRYATGGGDHTVKIWTYDTLFRMGKNEGKDPVGNFTTTSGYMSIEDTSSNTVPPATQTKPETGLLCTLRSHTGSVMCVKWTNSGKYLASASDDKLIFIYRLMTSIGGAGEGGGGFTGKEDPNKENWQKWRSLKHHNFDVIDLAWSPDDQFLTSSSLDSESPLCVWSPLAPNANQKFLSPHKILDVKGVHSQSIKGVAFDTLGKFMVTSSDDPCFVAVWRAGGDWGLENMKNSDNSMIFNSMVSSVTGNTMFRRISWSSDAAHIICTNTSSKSQKLSYLIPRSSVSNTQGGKEVGEERYVKLVGHKSSVVVSSSNPRLFKPKEGSSDTHSSILALGDKRGFVTVWFSGVAKPIFKMQLSETKKTITDMSWSRCGYILLVTSLDGYMFAIKFDPSELPTPAMTDEEINTHWVNTFGVSKGGAKVSDGKNSLVQSAMQIEGMEEENRSDNINVKRTSAAGGINTISGASSFNASDLLANQVVTKTKKGKKRIAPVIVPTSTTELDPSAVKFNVGGNGGGNGNTGTTNNSTKIAKSAASAAPTAHAAIGTLAMTAAAGTTKSTKSTKSNEQGAKPIKANAKQGGGQKQQAPQSPSTTSKKIQKHAEEASKKRKSTSSDEGARKKVANQIPAANVQQGTTAGAPITTQSQSSNSTATNKSFNHSLPPPLVSATQCIIEVPKKQAFNLPLTSSNGSNSTILSPIGNEVAALKVEAINASYSGNRQASRMSSTTSSTCELTISSSNGKVTFNDVLVGRASALTTCSSYFVLGTTSGEVYVYRTEEGSSWEENKKGKAIRAMPCLAVGGGGIAGLHIVEYQGVEGGGVKEVRLMCLTGTGEVTIWDLCRRSRKGKSYKSIRGALDTMARAGVEAGSGGKADELPSVERVSLQADSLGKDGEPALFCRLRKEGCVGGSEQGFFWHEGMEVWMRIADARFELSEHFENDSYLSSRMGSGNNFGANGIVRRMQAKVARGSGALNMVHIFSSASDTDSATVEKKQILTKAHCENQIAIAVVMRSPEEYKEWLGKYIKVLAENEDLDTIRMIGEELIRGNTNESQREEGVWSDCTELGLDKIDTMKNVFIKALNIG